MAREYGDAEVVVDACNGRIILLNKGREEWLEPDEYVRVDLDTVSDVKVSRCLVHLYARPGKEARVYVGRYHYP